MLIMIMKMMMIMMIIRTTIIMIMIRKTIMAMALLLLQLIFDMNNKYNQGEITIIRITPPINHKTNTIMMIP